MPSRARSNLVLATLVPALLLAIALAPSGAIAAVPVATIQGIVANSSGAPIPGMHVKLNGGMLMTPIVVATASDGTYALGVPEAGSYYIAADDPSLAYLTSITRSLGDVSAGIVTEDFVLMRPGRISGKVTDALTSAPVQGTEVQFGRWSDDLDYWDGTVFTDSNGEYLVTRAYPGPNAVYFYAGSSVATPYAPQWYGGAYVKAAATTVTVTEDATTPDINAALLPPAATSLSAAWAGTNSSDTTTPAYGATVVLGGSLKDDQGLDLKNDEVVDLEKKRPGTDWVRVGPGLPDASGAYSFRLRETGRTDYRLHFKGDVFHAASYSPRIVLYPKVKLSLNALKSSYSRKKTYKYAGAITPAHTASSTNVVFLRLSRWRSGGYKSYGTVKARIGATRTSYSASVRLPTAGKWRIVPVAKADSLHAETVGAARYTLSR